MRFSISSVEAAATSGPPHTRRSSLWTTPCGWLERRAQAATSWESSLRAAARRRASSMPEFFRLCASAAACFFWEAICLS